MILPIPPIPTELAQTILREAIREGDTVIDATAGNGYDTQFLAECVGASGRVLAYDIQESALQTTRDRIDAAGFSERTECFLTSHANMAEHAAGESVAAIMFNLGYLPGKNQGLTTESGETLKAIEIATELLKPGGVLSVVCYPGHDAGLIEAEAVKAWLSTLTISRWRIGKYAMFATKSPAPFLLVASKPG